MMKKENKDSLEQLDYSLLIDVAQNFSRTRGVHPISNKKLIEYCICSFNYYVKGFKSNYTLQLNDRNNHDFTNNIPHFRSTVQKSLIWLNIKTIFNNKK